MIINITIVLLFFTGLSQAQSIDVLIDEIYGSSNLDSNSNSFQNSSAKPTVVQNLIPNSNSNKSPNIETSVNIKECPAGKRCVPLHLCKIVPAAYNPDTLIDINGDVNNFEFSQECPFQETCCTLKDIIQPITSKLDPFSCGFRNIGGIAPITVDGYETQYGEFPWMMAVIQQKEIGNEFFRYVYKCGGSLIHPSVVLTSAHCISDNDSKNLTVRAGEWNTQAESEYYPHQDRDVVDIVIHTDYSGGSLFNDIALLFLDEPFKIADNVRTICLPPGNLNFDHSRCYATGWGKDAFGQNGKYQTILKKVKLSIVPNDECQKRLRTTRLGKYFELHESFICAGGEPGIDTCKGDGGSPLVCPISGTDKIGDQEQYYQAGIVAWGIGCGDPIPGVYASVAKLRPWIDEQLGYKRIDLSYYTP